MTKLAWHLLLFALMGTQWGCATVFTGTRSRVRVETSPPGALAVALGGAAGQVVRYAQKTKEISGTIVDLLGPHLNPELAQQLRGLDLDELVARLVGSIHAQTVRPEWAPMMAGLQQIPRPIIDKALEKVGLEAVGHTPLEMELGKGSPYALVVWQEGYWAKVGSVESRFNWVVLLNILNLGLGVPIDILTGAWLNVGPPKIELTLEQRPAGK